ncbi:MAG: neutral/alkaline non-lysosomal ceramidase N-terminal domain-containing protein [Verrucomicrobia bacterium]|nr:neutral/alkaline non-lysosomal ceramidase N-terminal domain-containing protein [Verrucomicrobiota bacterium]MBI3868132.1 neutral/alkaline non-lysosomal ceramidase N-terminal domain-containing protein [Verrucomicrobiota bacterium]
MPSPSWIRWKAVGGMIAALWLCRSGTAAEADLPWKAGFASARITPKESMWLSGYGSRDHPAEGVRIDLWAKSIALEDRAGVRGVIVTLDLVGVDRELASAVRSQIHQQTGIAADHIVLSCSHTHTGPVVGKNLDTMYFFEERERAKVDRYTDGLRSQVVQLAVDALSRLRPAKLSWAVGHESFGVNRRNNPEPLVPAHRAAGALRGPVDPSVPVLRIADVEGGLMGVVFGYACHATVLDDYLWSGDYPGFAQAELEQRHPSTHALFLQGCGADINPLPRRTPELARQYGRRLADSVDRALEGVLEPLSPELAIRYAEMDLPFDTAPARAQWEKLSEGKDRFAAAHARKMLAILDKQGRLPESYPYPLSVWRMGGKLEWVALGGEVVVDYSLRLKRELGPSLWVSGYCHDVMAYIPSRRVWEEGGYEGGGAMIYYGLPTRWAGDVESRIVDKAISLSR